MAESTRSIAKFEDAIAKKPNLRLVSWSLNKLRKKKFEI